MKKICILTATRAEYGLLRSLIEKLKGESDIDTNIVATGAHLSPEFGLTFQEIENDGFKIDKKIEMLVSADTPSSISKAMGLAMIGFADYFKDSNPDLLVILGDRYESLAVATVAMNQRIPIVHLHGGESTEGLIDEAIRHAITKLSYLHFTSTDVYRNRVIQLGEHPDRVFNVGSIGVDNIRRMKLMEKEQLEKDLEFSLKKSYAVVTFHPVTLDNESSSQQIDQLLKVCAENKNYNYIFTKGNSDAHGRVINQRIDEYITKHTNGKAFTSLGVLRYLSAVKYSSMVIGNSSSGIIEVPSFRVPTVNIGDRQKGRVQATSIINCFPESSSINNAISKSQSKDFLDIVQKTINPYEKTGTSEAISKKILEYVRENKFDIKKEFYDLKIMEE